MKKTAEQIWEDVHQAREAAQIRYAKERAKLKDRFDASGGPADAKALADLDNAWKYEDEWHKRKCDEAEQARRKERQAVCRQDALNHLESSEPKSVKIPSRALASVLDAITSHEDELARSTKEVRLAKACGVEGVFEELAAEIVTNTADPVLRVATGRIKAGDRVVGNMIEFRKNQARLLEKPLSTDDEKRLELLISESRRARKLEEIRARYRVKGGK